MSRKAAGVATCMIVGLALSSCGEQNLPSAPAVTRASTTAAISSPVVVVTGTGDWGLSTVSVDGGETPPYAPFDGAWNGVTSLPAASTYTLTPILDRDDYLAVPGSHAYGAQGNVRFYRTTFTLPAFGTVSADFRSFFDNEIDVFINGHEVAQDADFDFNWLGYGEPFRALAANGSVTNGYLGGRSFSRVPASFPASNWVSGGVNELVVAINNHHECADVSSCEPYGHAGGFSFLMTVTTTPLTADLCKNGGWQTLRRSNGTAFKNQGDCIQYVNTGK